jgi:hypothetical protein
VYQYRKKFGVFPNAGAVSQSFAQQNIRMYKSAQLKTSLSAPERTERAQQRRRLQRNKRAGQLGLRAMNNDRLPVDRRGEWSNGGGGGREYAHRASPIRGPAPAVPLPSTHPPPNGYYAPAPKLTVADTRRQY